MKQPDPLLALLSELGALLLHLLSKQRASHTHALLQLPPLTRTLTVRGHAGLALVSSEYLQLSLQPVRELCGFLLLGLIKANLEMKIYFQSLLRNQLMFTNRLFLQHLSNSLLILLS